MHHQFSLGANMNNMKVIVCLLRVSLLYFQKLSSWKKKIRYNCLQRIRIVHLRFSERDMKVLIWIHSFLEEIPFLIISSSISPLLTLIQAFPYTVYIIYIYPFPYKICPLVKNAELSLVVCHQLSLLLRWYSFSLFVLVSSFYIKLLLL